MGAWGRLDAPAEGAGTWQACDHPHCLAGAGRIGVRDVYSSEATVELLKVALEHLADSGKPGILAGDFNLRPDEVAEVLNA